VDVGVAVDVRVLVEVPVVVDVAVRVVVEVLIVVEVAVSVVVELPVVVDVTVNVAAGRTCPSWKAFALKIWICRISPTKAFPETPPVPTQKLLLMSGNVVGSGEPATTLLLMEREVLFTELVVSNQTRTVNHVSL